MDIISFPKLWGFKVNIDSIAFTLFGVSIYWYGIIISVALIVAVSLAVRAGKRAGIRPEDIIDVALFAVPVSIIFARIYYVIFSWEDFNYNILRIFNLRTGGLAIYGGIIGGIITVFLFCNIRKINMLKMLNVLAPYAALGQAIGRWGNFVNQEAYGGNTTLPWGMTSEKIRNGLEGLRLQGINVDPNIPVHPTFLYESLWDIIVFVLLIVFRRYKKLDGSIFYLYMILYGIGRFFIEWMRTDSLYLGPIRISQILAGAFVVVFSVMLLWGRGRPLWNTSE